MLAVDIALKFPVTPVLTNGFSYVEITSGFIFGAQQEPVVGPAQFSTNGFGGEIDVKLPNSSEFPYIKGFTHWEHHR